MNAQLHPVFAGALAPFTAAMKPYPTAVAIALTTHPYQPNELTKLNKGSMYEYQYVGAEGVIIDCFLDYSPAEKGSATEPPDDEEIDLVYALVNGIDIAEVLSDDVRGLIQCEALESMAMDKWDSDHDKGEELAECEA